MNKYVKNRPTKTINDILLEGFKKQEVSFINWETVTKKGNT